MSVTIGKFLCRPIYATLERYLQNKNGRRKASGDYFQLALENHCIFCLDQFSLDELNYSETDMRPLQLIRCYFNEKRSEEDEDNFKSLPNSPPTCQSCFSHFKKLQELHAQSMRLQELVQKQVGAIRDVVRRSSVSSTDSSKWDDVVENLSSCGHPKSQVEKTCELVRGLHELITEEIKVEGENEYEEFPGDLVKEEIAENSGDDAGFKMEDSDEPEAGTAFGHGEICHESDNSGNSDAAYSGEDQGADTNSETTPNKLRMLLMKPDNESLKSEVFSPENNNQSEWNAREKLQKRKVGKKQKPAQKTNVAKRLKRSVVEKGTKKKEQLCDLCGEYIPIANILQHIQGHVKGYATKCVIPSCPFVFSCQLKMLVHLRTSRKCTKVAPIDQSGNCQHCSHKSRNARTLQSHLRTHELEMGRTPGALPLECPLENCNETFHLVQSMEYHIYSHDLRLKTKQNCPICGEPTELSKIEEHLLNEHRVEKVFKCNHCSCVFESADDKIKHIYGHRDINGVSCDICNDESIKIHNIVSLQQHYFSEHQLGTSPALTCQHCGRECISLAGLKNHERLVHGKNGAGRLTKGGGGASSLRRPKSCDICLEQFGCHASMTNHKIRVHGSPHIPCKVCSATFPSTSALQFHMRKHSGTVLKCQVDSCGKEFRNNASLKSHMEFCHSDGKKEKKSGRVCDICGKEYRSREGLARHMKAVHLGTRTRCVCEECGKSFARLEFLREHMRTHTGELPFVCNICGRAFRHKSSHCHHLKKHEKKGQV